MITKIYSDHLQVDLQYFADLHARSSTFYTEWQIGIDYKYKETSICWKTRLLLNIHLKAFWIKIVSTNLKGWPHRRTSFLVQFPSLSHFVDYVPVLFYRYKMPQLHHYRCETKSLHNEVLIERSKALNKDWV